MTAGHKTQACTYFLVNIFFLYPILQAFFSLFGVIQIMPAMFLLRLCTFLLLLPCMPPTDDHFHLVLAPVKL